MKLYTIGHSNLAASELVDVLREHDVSWVADVRSAPYSRRFPQFNRRPLAETLKASGIHYLFLGDKLGGKPGNAQPPSELWAQGKLNPALVSGLSDTPHWADGMRLLVKTVKALGRQGHVGCLLCSEGDANNCHRSLISFQLEQQIPGLLVRHLRPGGNATEVRFQKTLFVEGGSDAQGTHH